MNQPKTEEEAIDLTLDQIFVLASVAEDRTAPSIDLDKVIDAAFTEVEVERSTPAAWGHLCGRIREAVSSLSIAWVGRGLRRAAFTVHTALIGFFKSRGAAFAIVGAAAAIAGAFVLFAPLPGNDSPLLSLPTFTGPAADIGEDDAGVGNGEEGDAGVGNDDHSVALPGAGHAGPGNDPEPGQDLGPPPPGKEPPSAPGKEPPSAPGEGPHPGQIAGEPPPPAPGEEPPSLRPSSVSPEVQEERKVELSTQVGQESVEIDWWRQVDDKSGDLQMNEDGIHTVLGAKLSVIDASSEPTYDRCAQVQTWTTRVDFTTLYEGSQLCAQSREGRYAMVRVIDLPWSPGSNGRFVFYGRTWQLPS